MRRSSNGNTALMKACENGHEACARLLIDANGGGCDGRQRPLR